MGLLPLTQALVHLGTLCKLNTTCIYRVKKGCFLLKKGTIATVQMLLFCYHCTSMLRTLVCFAMVELQLTLKTCMLVAYTCIYVSTCRTSSLKMPYVVAVLCHSFQAFFYCGIAVPQLSKLSVITIHNCSKPVMAS